MFDIPEAFDFTLFTTFMEANPSIKFSLDFHPSVSDEYTKMLQDYVDVLIETSSYKNRKVLIEFLGQKDEYFFLLNKQYYI
uniref:Uncharacterized protein n=1 Tax=Panagrolaimus sp. ES5 TaxID=591445 RepID=A0AC34FM90_9BILA